MNIRLFALDVDGVLTDGTIFYTGNGEEIKGFHAQDGLGLGLLKKLGVHIAVVSGRTSKPLEKRLDDLGIKIRRLSCKDKVFALQDICGDLKLSLDEVAFMGDDLIDLEAMEVAAFSIAPANAVEPVLGVADLVTEKSGGQGAVREACEHLAVKMGQSLEAVARGNKAVPGFEKVLVQ